ncbi:TatD family hydrolase [Endozoicomonas sp. SM1973]|uniref:TatD family hydrolase n=1 Tax=Spartinivicinus marinus TaxID=2994442 RepID=A0A853HXC6_9GAMM|nr:TatD family hydrolase [Spartinivicinus marinus]MCX4029445.1 TatD family hydrolase [Spartinivicinus marinus]NYZ65019.1 TatD family hydrolase [Spartinivicinus marinus]
MLIDSHCHLDRIDLAPYQGDLSAALQQASSRGVAGFLAIAVDKDNINPVVEIAQLYDNVWASVGIHPLSAAEGSLPAEELISHAIQEKVVAIGETGLDYYYDQHSQAEQLQSFVDHIAVAKQLNKPLVIHTRQAKADTLALLRSEGAEQAGGVLHCFTEDWDMAKQAMDLGFYISISGIVTFKKATNVHEVAKKVPLDRLLVETDSPYLAPVPYRGKTNEPQYVVEVAKCLAELRGESFEELAQQTTKNFFRLFTGAR